MYFLFAEKETKEPRHISAELTTEGSKSRPKIQPDGFVVAQATATWGPKPSGSHIFGITHALIEIG